MEKLKDKNIIIIGGGITGLTLLHFLRQKYAQRPEVTISLFEKNIQAGGSIHTLERSGARFECGPNGFLDNKEITLRLIRDLSLNEELVTANEESALRSISLNNRLHRLPTGPKDLWKSTLFNTYEKLRFFSEPLVGRSEKPAESVYDFVKRRFGSRAAEYLADPFVSGIYAGDARNILMKAAFPQVQQWEKDYGSVLKAMQARKQSEVAPPMPKLTSFKRGMGQIIETLSKKYEENLRIKETVIKVFHRQDRYVVGTEKETFKADELFICTPAYASSGMLRSLDGEIADDLAYMAYAPVVVLGLLVPDNIFDIKPEGFGYLIPSSQNKEILGVLFESNIFPYRAPKGHLLMRVILGGVRYADIFHKSKKELMEMAFTEIETTFHTRGSSPLTKIDLQKVAVETFYITWEKAIPQYDQVNAQMNAHIDLKLKRFRDLYLLGNYRSGVSFNDCIESAFQYSQRSSL